MDFQNRNKYGERVRAHFASGKMSNYAFNCSSTPSSAQYAYDPSRSPEAALQVCYRLLKAKCAHLGLDASYCENSQSSTTGDKIYSMYRATYCDNYYNITDSVLALSLATPIIFAFLLNSCRLIVRTLRRRAAPAPDNSALCMSMIDPLAESSLFIPAAPHVAPTADSDSLGVFGRLLPFIGLQWIRAPKSSLARQILRVGFLLWTALAVIPLSVQYQRLYLARFDALTFSITFNQCSSLCSASGQSACSMPYNISFNCLPSQRLSILSSYLECFDAGNVDVLVQSGLAVQLLLLLLPLHSAVSCALLWPRPDNPVLLALHALRQLSPDRHNQCCASAMKFIVMLAIVLTVLSIISSQIYNPIYQDSCNDTPCLSPNMQTYPKLVCHILIYTFLSLTPVAIVSLFTFTAFIVRLRMRAFVSLAEFISTSAQLHRDDDRSLPSAIAPNSKPSAHDVVTALHLLRCPHSVLSKCTALLRVDSESNYKDAAAAVQPQMRLLWTMQLRDSQRLAKFGGRWLLVQAIFALIFLFPIASFLSLASQYSSLIFVVLPILQLYSLFCVPFIAAILALAIGNFYVQHACHKLSLLLERCSEAAERNTEAFGPTFNQHDSLSEIVTFCRYTSDDAFCLYGVQINWLSLARFVYYMGLLVWVLSTSIIGSISTGFKSTLSM
jgi:hypothetical protein